MEGRIENSEGDGVDAETFLNKCSCHRVTADSIEFHGVQTTRTNALKKEVSELFRATNLNQLIRDSGKAAIHMMEMGLFEECQAFIDTTPASNNGEQKYIVKFFATELRNPFKISVKMEMKTSGEADASVSAKKANIFGRGESAELTYSKGLRKDGGYSFGFSASKPLLGWQRYENFASQIHNKSDFLRWNNADLHESAASFMFNNYVAQKIHWPPIVVTIYGSWRLFLPRNETPFSIREQSGHTTKFSLEHTLSADGRDHRLLPTSGSLLKLSTEYAPGAVGDSAFLKNIFDFQTSSPLFGGLFFGVSLRLAAVHAAANRSIHVLDRLYLGGPFDVRGFELNSIGATKADNCSLGGSALLSTACHLYAPLFPKDIFFAHLFISTGSLSPFRSKRRLNDLWELHRVTAGLGIVVNLLNMVRLELNYTVPLRTLPGDVCSHGIQFGAGLNFM